MNQHEAEVLKMALDNLIHCLDVPMHLAANSGDDQLKRLIGTLSAEIVSKIDFEILPHLCRDFPNLKSNDTET